MQTIKSKGLISENLEMPDLESDYIPKK